MTIDFFLLTSEPLKADGFPLVVRISHGSAVPVKRQIGRSQIADFNTQTRTLMDTHPDYDILAPMMMEMRLKARKIVLRKETDVKKALSELFTTPTETITLLEYFEVLKGQMKELIAKYTALKDIKSAKRISGNLKVYENAITQFSSVIPNVLLSELDYPTLLRFKNYQLGLGNSKNTVHQYLRTLRAIYNKAQLFYKLSADKPFTGVFSGLKVKSYANKKKYITRDTLVVLEGLSLIPVHQQYIDLWLLCFYFGGADLNDVYYLKKSQLRRGRIYCERGKTENPLMIDLKVHPKAKAILDRYPSPDEWLLPWRKDEKGYESFRRRHQKILVKIQQEHNIAVDLKKTQLGKMTEEQEAAIDAKLIEVMPGGGNLGIKVARHTFGNLGKLVGIDPELLRELMGHERDQVDNFYKDRFPEQLRDEALFKIIG